MNVNSKLLTLGDTLNCPIAQDIYKGSEQRFLTFTYADERGELFGDNVDIYDTVWIKLKLMTPINYNYFADKKLIKKSLLKMGFCIQDIYSRVEDDLAEAEHLRATIFDITYTDMEE